MDELFEFIKKELLAGVSNGRIIREKYQKETGNEVSLNRVYKRIDKCNKLYKNEIDEIKKESLKQVFPTNIQKVDAMKKALNEIYKIIGSCAKEKVLLTPSVQQVNDIKEWCQFGLNIIEK